MWTWMQWTMTYHLWPNLLCPLFYLFVFFYALLDHSTASHKTIKSRRSASLKRGTRRHFKLLDVLLLLLLNLDPEKFWTYEVSTQKRRCMMYDYDVRLHICARITIWTAWLSLDDSFLHICIHNVKPKFREFDLTDTRTDPLLSEPHCGQCYLFHTSISPAHIGL